MIDTTNKAKHTSLPWVAIPQNGAGSLIAHVYETHDQMRPTGLRLIAHMLERKSSLAEDRANAELIVTAVNAWDDADALRARLLELEARS